MRVEFTQALLQEHPNHSDLLVLTGDLGFMALEKVQELYGERFINTGIAEQNMVTMAASLARENFIPFVYSISPFVTHRPYEQIRNDICLHGLPVKLVGNGGGYGYGIMGSTHHNLEDIGAMRGLPDMKVYVPVTAADVFESVSQMIKDPQPNYLRLNLAANIPDAPSFEAWRTFKSGDKAVVISTGPIVGNLYKLPAELLDALEIWSVGIFPVPEIPSALMDKIAQTKKVIILEEHSEQCGLHETIAAQLLQRGVGSIRYEALNSKGYISGKYGDQTFHQTENNLAGAGLEITIRQVLS